MKKLFIIASIVLLLLSCNIEDMEDDSNKVTVTFETFGGTEIAPVKVKIGTPIGRVLPNKDPVKAEHEFEGWFTNEGFDFNKRVYDYSEKPVDEDITLYAKLVWYYPFEVSNVSHTFDPPLLTLTWTNPDDENFYNVIINNGSNVTPGDNSYKLVWYSGEGVARIRCVDKNGNYSKGVFYSYDVGLL